MSSFVMHSIQGLSRFMYSTNVYSLEKKFMVDLSLYICIC